MPEGWRAFALTDDGALVPPFFARYRAGAIDQRRRVAVREEAVVRDGRLTAARSV